MTTSAALIDLFAGSAGRSRRSGLRDLEVVAELDLAREDLVGDPIAVRQQFLLATRERDHDAVGQLEPGALAHGVERVDEVEHAAFAAQSVVERGVEGDANAVVLSDRPALERHALAADHLFGLEQLAGRAQPAVVELLDVTPLERGPYLGQLGAEPRPEQAQ